MPTIFTRIQILPSADFGADGSPFQCHAPSTGLALVGLSVRSGEWIDQVTPLFAELLDDGSIGKELCGLSYGGRGGAPGELRVRPGHVVVGLQTRSGRYVDAIRLLEARWDGAAIVPSERSWTPWIGGRGGVERPERLLEPVGNAVAIGIAGSAGAFVETLTLVSGQVLQIPAGVATSAALSRGARSASV